MNNKDISRRAFIQRLSLFGAAGIGASSLLAACGGGEQQTSTPAADTPAPAAEGFTCTDTSGLTEAEVTMRTQLQYVDESPDPAKVCSGCALFVAPAAGGQCGTCQVVKGPIHPDGYCTSWAQKPA
jgi:hypothetical protein